MVLEVRVSVGQKKEEGAVRQQGDDDDDKSVSRQNQIKSNQINETEKRKKK